jgi:hypothetical protein
MSDREISSESMDFFTGLVGLEDRTGTFHGKRTFHEEYCEMIDI